MTVAYSDSLWFTEEPSQFSVDQIAQSLTCSVMEKPHTGLDDSLNLLRSCFGKRMSGLEVIEIPLLDLRKLTPLQAGVPHRGQFHRRRGHGPPREVHRGHRCHFTLEIDSRGSKSISSFTGTY